MAWHFDTSLSTDKDKVRFLIGDTNTRRQLCQDETIEAILTMEANIYMAAAEIAEYIARGLTAGGVLEDRKVGETRIRYRRAADMLALAGRLRTRGATHMKPSAGGIYISDRDSYDGNTALDKPELATGMTDNPRVSGSLTNKTS
jgi:hypothetical protein